MRESFWPPSITDGYVWKGLISILIYLFGGSGITKQLYGPFLVLMALDLVTGIWASAKEGKGIKSQTLIRRTVRKFGSYALIIIAARMMENILIISLNAPLVLSDWSVRLAVLYLSTAEATSIDENLRRAAGIGLGAILKRFIGKSGFENGGPEPPKPTSAIVVKPKPEEAVVVLPPDSPDPEQDPGVPNR